MKKNNSSTHKIKKIVTLALFGALAYVLMLVVHIKVAHLTFDAKDAVITIAGLAFGPIASLILSLLVAMLEMISPASTTGWFGFIMNFVSTAVFSCTCSLIYKYKRNFTGAILGLVSAIFATTAVMMGLNILVTPLFNAKITTEAVLEMIPTLLLPFNFTKYTLNGALVVLLYKPVSTALKSVGVLLSDGKQDAQKNKFKIRQTVLLISASLVVIAVSIVVLIVFLNGSFSWYK